MFHMLPFVLLLSSVDTGLWLGFYSVPLQYNLGSSCKTSPACSDAVISNQLFMDLDGDYKKLELDTMWTSLIPPTTGNGELRSAFEQGMP